MKNWDKSIISHHDRLIYENLSTYGVIVIFSIRYPNMLASIPAIEIVASEITLHQAEVGCRKHRTCKEHRDNARDNTCHYSLGRASYSLCINDRNTVLNGSETQKRCKVLDKRDQ